MTSIHKLLSLVALSTYMVTAFSQVTFGSADTAYIWQDTKQQFVISEDHSAAFLRAQEDSSPATLSTQDFNPSDVCHWHLHFSMVGAFTAYNYLSLFLAANLKNDGSVADGLCVRLGGNKNKSISLVQIYPDGTKQVLCESDANILRPNYPFSIDVYRMVVDNADSSSPLYSFAVYCDISDNNELVCESKENLIPADYIASHPTTAIEVVFTKTYANNKTMVCDFFIENCKQQGNPTNPEPEPEPKPEPEPNPSEIICNRGDIVINEIMYHPTADFALPEIEWVELYNTTDDTISLSRWTWYYSSRLPDNAFIEPHGYVVLCAKKHADDLSQYVQCPVYSTSSWPELNNNAKSLFLSDSNNSVVDYIYYDNNYFKDNFKSQGGWSLERIDPLNLNGSMSNWLFSTNDVYGATPGYTNSVNCTNVDTAPPCCLYALMSDSQENTFRLHFSEPIDTINIPASIVINEVSVPCSLYRANRYALNWLDISVEKNLQHNVYYTLDVSDFSDLAGNEIVPTAVKVGYADTISTNDVIINEIMSKASPASHDYLELYNRSRKNIDLYSLCVASLNDDNSIKTIYPIQPHHKILFPNEYLVVTKDSIGVISAFSPQDPSAIINSAKFPALSAEGSVAISSRNGSIIDMCQYNNSMHSPLSKNMYNVSLERIHPNISSSEMSNWTSASELSNYATPSARNSQFRAPASPSEEEFNITTRVFSPSSSNLPNCAVISTRFTDGSWYASFQVYTANGHLIATPYNNSLLPTTGELTWNGQDSNGHLQPPGTYIIYISAWQTGGKTTQFKSTVTILAE